MLDRKRYIGVEDGKEGGGRTRNEDRIERFLKAFESFPPHVLEFAKKNHVTASILEHPIYFRPVGRSWGSGRVTMGECFYIGIKHFQCQQIFLQSYDLLTNEALLINLVGDAAHMMPPNMAMGTPLALEDSVSLAHCLLRYGLNSKALREYEIDRQPRVNKIAYKAITDTGLYYTKKDENANPFKLNDEEMLDFVMNFTQDPIPSCT